MKNILKAAVLCLGILAAANVSAQTKKDTTFGQKVGGTAKKVGKATAKTAKKVGHKTSELASKGSSAVIDKKLDTKVGPGGQTIYINNKSQYYYVNKKGKRVYVTAAQLKDKP